MNQPTPPLRPPTDAPPVGDDSWSAMYGKYQALIDHAVDAAGRSLAAIEAGDEAGARQLLADAEARWRAADRLIITMTMRDDEQVVVTDPVVYAVHHATTHVVDNPLARMIEAVTRNQEEEADLGTDR